MVKSIYELSVILDDPLYEGFRFKRGTKSVLGRKIPAEDFDPKDDGTLDWQPVPLSKIWRPPTLNGPVRPFNDYPEIELEVPCFSKRAVEALRELLEPNGELLPVESKVGEYYAYNILTKVDALDLSRSKVEFFPGENRVAAGIDYFAFDRSRIDDLSIFRVKEKWAYTLVTDSFKKRVEDAQLNGFLFSKVWPLRRGVHWRDLAAEVRRDKAKKSPIRGESIFIDLELAGAKPTTKESGSLRKMVELIEYVLADQTTKRSPYLGAVEHADVLKKGIVRISLSCPSVEILAPKILAWIKDRPWDGKIVLIKRRCHVSEEKKRKQEIVQVRERVTSVKVP